MYDLLLSDIGSFINLSKTPELHVRWTYPQRPLQFYYHELLGHPYHSFPSSRFSRYIQTCMYCTVCLAYHVILNILYSCREWHIGNPRQIILTSGPPVPFPCYIIINLLFIWNGSIQMISNESCGEGLIKQTHLYCKCKNMENTSLLTVRLS